MAAAVAISAANRQPENGSKIWCFGAGDPLKVNLKVPNIEKTCVLNSRKACELDQNCDL